MMNEIPNISIFGSAHRPENWMNLYRSIGDNDISFEIIFVGPNEPDFELPSNFKFIKSYTKPTQCLEIAARNTMADLIMNLADDVEFRTKHPLDNLYSTYKSYNNEKLILSCRYMIYGKDISDECLYFFVEDKSSPVVALCGLMSKKLYRDIGGIDRNFIAGMWDSDIAMRVLALGGNVVISDVCLEELFKSTSPGQGVNAEFWHHDRGLLESLWSKKRSLWSRFIKSLFMQREKGESLFSRKSLSKRRRLMSFNKETHFNRSRPVEPFSDFRILEESQGPKGRWI